MKLTFLYQPVSDLGAAVAFYRDVLGWDEAWRMGDDTAAMQIPDSPVQAMLTLDPDPAAAASGFFEVADVDAFAAAHGDRLDIVEAPQDSPPVRFMSFRDPDGNLIRIYTEIAQE